MQQVFAQSAHDQPRRHNHGVEQQSQNQRADDAVEEQAELEPDLVKRHQPVRFDECHYEDGTGDAEGPIAGRRALDQRKQTNCDKHNGENRASL